MTGTPGQTSVSVAAGIARHRSGDVRGAAEIYKAVLGRNPEDPKALHYLGLAMIQTGDLEKANQLLERAVRANPANANAISDLATAKLKLERLDEAIPLFARALELNPDHIDALYNMGMALCSQQRLAEALPLLVRHTELNPASARGFQQRARTEYRLGRAGDAIKSYEQALALDPNSVATRIGLGEALESAGRHKPARLQYLAILRREENDPVALARLLQLPDDVPDPAWVSRASALADDGRASSDARALLNVALAHHFDRQRDYDTAFRRLQHGNELQRRRSPYRNAEFARSADRLVTFFSREFFGTAADYGCDSARPIFIVGMPRSGTTMMEQILSSHTDVVAGGELSTILNLAAEVRQLSRTGRSYPEGLADLARDDFARLANEYLKRIAEVSANRTHVTDKLPFNFIHLGFIATLFPRARIIHCMRDPLDTCLSCYFTSFTQQIQFANDLNTLARYYLDYRKLIDHWRRVLPGRILDVQYESVVGSPEAEIRRLLDHCGLEWQEACLKFHETQRDIKTPSRWQVRKPVYTGSVGRWRHYEKHLLPLAEALSAILPQSGS